MRVPLFIVILLSITVVGVTWWRGTRDMDFMSAPSDLQLAAIRTRVAETIPPPIEPELATIVPPPSEPVLPRRRKPELDLGNLLVHPELDEYLKRADDGPEVLLQMATLLERQGEYQRALLACERVVDSTKPSDEQTEKVLALIRQLKTKVPDWVQTPKDAIPITLHAGTGKSTARVLAPALETAARKLENASSGILKVKPVITASSRDIAVNGPAPVAIWLAGPDEDSPSTDVLSFTVVSQETLPISILKTSFSLVHGSLSRSARKLVPIPLVVGGDPADALATHVSRLGWEEFGRLLNPPKKPETTSDSPQKKPK